MTDHVAIDVDAFRAVALCASSEETRYYLRGVSLQVIGGKARIAATDGHRLMAYTFETHYSGEIDIIIPTETIKKCFTGWPRTLAMVLIEGSGRDWKMGDVAFTPVDGTFPDWSRVMPDLSSGEAGTTAHFNHKYIGELAKAEKFLGMTATIHHNGNSPALITFGERDDLLMLLMPKRKDMVGTRTTTDLRLLIDSVCHMPASTANAA